MCGGKYDKWGDTPKQLAKVNGETLVERTIRLLRENGVEDIAISATNPIFEQFGVPVLKHDNERYNLKLDRVVGDWLDAFYPSSEPICYLFGDVVFSPYAIKTIVEYETDDIMFFASAEPLPKDYPKEWAEPFAYKVVDTVQFFTAISRAKTMDKHHRFNRQPVSWELWQVIKGTPINKIDYTNYVAINDYTCDIDSPEDIKLFEGIAE